MATLTTHEDTGAREFMVEFAGPMRLAPFTSGGRIFLAADRADRPQRLAVQFEPSDFEFQARLPQLAKQVALPVPASELSFAAARASAAVTYEADAALLAGLPAAPRTLPDLDGYLRALAPGWDWEHFALSAIELSRPTGEPTVGQSG